MQQARFHHANMLADQLWADLQLQGTEMLAMVQELVIADNNPPTSDAQSPPQPAANAALQESVQLEMLRLLRKILEERRGGPGGRGRGSGCGYGRGNGDRNRNRCTSDNVIFARLITNSYCSTHGVCNHTLVDCTCKALGHRDNSTRENHMGGSNTFCQYNAE